MGLKPEVVDAFRTLGVDPSVDQATASQAYKKLSLKHHPDRNYGDASATERFQEVGVAPLFSATKHRISLFLLTLTWIRC